MQASANDDFQARLDRIRVNNGQSVMMVGQDEQYVLTRKEIVQTSRGREISGNLVYPASLLGAVVLGMVAVFASHYIRFQLMAGAVQSADPATEMLVVAGIGLAASFVLSQAFKLTTKEHRTLQGIGVFLMVCLFHNLSHWLPGPMSLAFSPEYVQTMTLGSPPNSFQFRGTYFPLFDTARPEDAPILASAPKDGTTNAPAKAETPLPVVRKGGKIVQGG